MNKYFPTIAAAALCYAISKYADNQMVKAAALGALGTVVLNQIPYVKAAV